ncbi:MAG: DUF2490 domain-containing protein [Nitrosomonas sp.]|nr:DUF2490 domain-containing protein [Nitrosomonas sp.]MCW5608424.1 DUF2490 domain-containing protein [Nitrosomonas sp.]
MFKKISVFITWMIFALIFSAPIAAEKTVDDFEVWGNITATGNFGFIDSQKPDLKKFRWWMEGQGRFGNDADQFSQGIIRPGVGYNVTDKLSLWGGYAFIPTAEPFTLKTGRKFDEHRIWQQAIWSDNTPLGRLTIRTRFEQRFFTHTAPVPGSNPVAHRFRQLIKLAIPLAQIDPDLSFIIQDELFINMTTMHDGFISRGFDQNRGFVGLGYKINQLAVAELGYMNQYLNRPHSARPDQMQHILGVNLFLNF